MNPEKVTNQDLATTFGQCGYEVLSIRGKGSYGTVYVAKDRSSNQLVALKYVLKDWDYSSEGYDNLIEIDIMSRIFHPYILHREKIITTEICPLQGLALILPLADRTLTDIIGDYGVNTIQRIAIAYKLAQGLRFLHQNGVLHLDIKAENVVLRDIKDNHPYFIDFGLSMIVDDINRGKKDARLRITPFYRPPEIEAGDRIYRGSVDVWSFGILLLQLLSRTDKVVFYSSKASLHEALLLLFTTSDYITQRLSGLTEKIQPLAVDLLTRMIKVNPQERISMEVVCQHPLFADLGPIIEGTVLQPKIEGPFSSDHVMFIKLLVFWAFTIFDSLDAEVLFMAVDLYIRVSKYYREEEHFLERINLVATCLWMAPKLTSGGMMKLENYVPQLNNLIDDIEAEDLLLLETKIITLTEGCLYNSWLYHSCRSKSELILSFKYVILEPDPMTYADLDLPDWLEKMRANLPNTSSKNKQLTIQQLIKSS